MRLVFVVSVSRLISACTNPEDAARQDSVHALPDEFSGIKVVIDRARAQALAVGLSEIVSAIRESVSEGLNAAQLAEVVVTTRSGRAITVADVATVKPSE